MLPQPTTPPPTDPAESDYRALLDDLMADAKSISRLAALRATQESETPPPETRADAAISARIVLDLSTAQENAARGIRRAILLVRNLDDPAAKSPQNRIAARKHIIRDVENAIQRHAPRPTDAACLQAELLDRLDSPDLDDDIDNLPIPEIITNICRDFGLAETRPGGRPWKRRTPEDIALLCARAARPPSAPQAAPPPSAAPANPPSDRAEDPERVFRLVATPNPA